MNAQAKSQRIHCTIGEVTAVATSDCMVNTRCPRKPPAFIQDVPGRLPQMFFLGRDAIVSSGNFSGDILTDRDSSIHVYTYVHLHTNPAMHATHAAHIAPSPGKPGICVCVLSARVRVCSLLDDLYMARWSTWAGCPTSTQPFPASPCVVSIIHSCQLVLWDLERSRRHAPTEVAPTWGHTVQDNPDSQRKRMRYMYVHTCVKHR